MSRRRPAFCIAWPWHEKQFCDRIGRTSQFQSGRSGMAALPAAAAWAASLVAWPPSSWEYARRAPAVTATMLAPVSRLKEPILGMEGNLFVLRWPIFVPTQVVCSLDQESLISG